jgi:N-acetylmuramoyl-L-alanine amidase
MKNQTKLQNTIILFLSLFFVFPISNSSSVFAMDEFNILDLIAEEKISGILVEIFLTQPLQYEIFADQNQILNISFYQGKLDTAFFNEKKLSEFLTWIKAYQFENSAQLSLRLIKPFVNFTHNLRTDPYRIQISLVHAPPSTDTAESSLSGISNEHKEPLNGLIDVVVLDPGHGGEDSGAVGKSGLLEKEVTLDIAKRVKSLLEKEKGIKVFLTRDADVLVPLEERPEIANQNGADIFVSIHTNASKKISAEGCETFFLSAAKNDEARAIAALENSAIRFEHPESDSEDVDDLNFILMDLVQSEFLMESSDLAGMIQNRLKSELSIPSRGVSQAGFRVLNHAYMPAVLVETAFISNKKEESLLKKSSFREKIAQAIYESIKEFKKKYESIE